MNMPFQLRSVNNKGVCSSICIGLIYSNIREREEPTVELVDAEGIADAAVRAKVQDSPRCLGSALTRDIGGSLQPTAAVYPHPNLRDAHRSETSLQLGMFSFESYLPSSSRWPSEQQIPIGPEGCAGESAMRWDHPHCHIQNRLHANTSPSVRI